MRLICPNCSAQYEVDENVIPSSGRDVQCSSCGHTWFQVSAATQAAKEEQEESQGLPEQHEIKENAAQDTSHQQVGEPEDADEEEPSALEKILAEETLEDVLSAEDDTILTEEEIEETVVSTTVVETIAEIVEAGTEEAADESEDGTPPRQKPDESILSILREEADAEIKQREQEILSGLETQTDLGLDDAEPDTTAEAGEHPAQTQEPEATQADLGTGTRRDLLPDIEEINSTLRPASERDDGDEDNSTVTPEVKTRRRRGFRLGFGFVLLLLTLAILAYVYAPAIVRKVPQSEPYVVAYVEKVNSLRLWIDDWMKRAIVMMGGDKGPDATMSPDSGTDNSAGAPTSEPQN